MKLYNQINIQNEGLIKLIIPNCSYLKVEFKSWDKIFEYKGL